MDQQPLDILVTGSSDFIDTHVVRLLHAAGHKVMALDQMPPKATSRRRLVFRLRHPSWNAAKCRI